MKKTIYTLIAILGFANFTMAQVPNYVPTNGLVGWWPFDGNTIDESINTNDGTVNGATLTTDRFGNPNKAYNFNGFSDYIIIQNTLLSSTTSSLTISLWYKTTDLDANFISDRYTGSNYLKYFVGISEGQIVSGNYSSSCNNPVLTNVLNNNWSNLVIVKNLSLNLNLIYLNGLLVNSSSSVCYHGSNNPTQIGRWGGGNEAYYSGKLDDIGFWNRALTETEITALFTSSSCDTITKQPINQTVNINTNASFILATTDSLATYQWQSDLGMGFQNISSAGQFNGATNDTLIVSNISMTNNNQNFRCIVSSGICKDTSSIAKLTVNNNSGINSPSNVNALKVYPNPASTILHIDLEKPGYYTSKLSSVAGQSIVSPTTGTIDISALANGVYILTIYDSNNKLISTNKVAILK
jgi:hypothetical protein